LKLTGHVEKIPVAHRGPEDSELDRFAVGSGLAPTTAAEPAAASAPPLVARFTILPNQEVRVTRPLDPGWHLDAAALVLDIPTENEAILVVGPELRRIERGGSDEELMQRAARGISAWRRERSHTLRRLELPDRLVAFSEELHRAPTLAAVYAALATHVARVVGGYSGIVFAYDNGGSAAGALRPVEHPGIDRGLAECALGPELRFRGPGLVRADDVLATAGGPFSSLAPIVRATGAATLSYVPLGERGLLVLVERRVERVFGPEDWDLLLSVARLAELALDRVELFDRVHDLSLTDPLTRLANRRRLDGVLERSFAAARRGQELSVVMIDLDRFKEYNDSYGHLLGDEILRRFAAALRETVRESDLVVRYGGDEFLIVMAGASRSVAERIVARIRARTPDIEFTAGIAHYCAELNSPHELLERADQDLYATRRRRTARRSADSATDSVPAPLQPIDPESRSR
jgi:diguanylate cyclase (GGDEF)-like protein